MRGLPFVALCLVAVGLVLLGWGLLAEGSQVHVVLVFPVFVLRGPLSTLGAFLLFLGTLLGFFSLAWAPVERLRWGDVHPMSPQRERQPRHGEPLSRPAETPPKEKRFGGVLLLGPIPIVFGSDVRVTAAMLILALVLTVLLLLLFLA